jgi:DNA-binding transcriptional regulator/RsmH inhibitor MraZ
MWRMAVFAGRFRHTVDAKNRVAIPSEFRRVLETWSSEKAVMARVVDKKGSGGVIRQYVELLPIRAFEELAGTDGKRTSLDLSVEQSDLLDRTFGESAALELDGQGRILLPEEFMLGSRISNDPLSKPTLGRDVLMVGLGSSIAVWNYEDYVRYNKLKQGAPGSSASGSGNGPGDRTSPT